MGYAVRASYDRRRLDALLFPNDQANEIRWTPSETYEKRNWVKSGWI